MACSHPITGYQKPNGGLSLIKRRGYSDKPMTVPCGQCYPCRVGRVNEWAVRISHEIKCWPQNCFVTLTYNDEHLPEGGTLVKDDFRLFMDRLRKRHLDLRIRFYHCGEYGDQNGRPHYHAIIFNFDFGDKYFWRTSKSGHKLYRSKELEELWPFGNCEVGSATTESAAYVAGYVVKKLTGDQAVEYGGRVPPYSTMSLKPGIGGLAFEKWSKGVLPLCDFYVVDGRKVPVPRYYERLAVRGEEASVGIRETRTEKIKAKRVRKAKPWSEETKWNSTPERLAVREECLVARRSRLKRDL